MASSNSAESLIDAAEEYFKSQKPEEALTLAIRVKHLNPQLVGILDRFIAAYRIHVAAAKKNSAGKKDWYAVLGIVYTDIDTETIKKRYKNLALLVHPDKNTSVAAESAFKLILEAWNVLSSSHPRSSARASPPRSSGPPRSSARASPPRSSARTKAKEAKEAKAKAKAKDAEEAKASYAKAEEAEASYAKFKEAKAKEAKAKEAEEAKAKEAKASYAKAKAKAKAKEAKAKAKEAKASSAKAKAKAKAGASSAKASSAGVSPPRSSARASHPTSSPHEADTNVCRKRSSYISLAKGYAATTCKSQNQAEIIAEIFESSDFYG